MAIFRRVDKLIGGMIVRLPDGQEWIVDNFPIKDGDRWAVRFYNRQNNQERGYRMFPDDMVELGDI